MPIPVVLLIIPPLIAALALSFLVIAETDRAYTHMGLTLAILVLIAALIVTRIGVPNTAVTIVCLALYYFGVSLFIGMLLAFVARTMELPWTMHVKDPGFGILLPLLVIGGPALAIGIMGPVLMQKTSS